MPTPGPRTDDDVLGVLVRAVALVAVPVLVGAAFVAWWTGRFTFLDAEDGPAAAVSAAALVAAGLACLWAGTRAGRGRAFLAVGAVLLLMAVDEWFVVHERLEAGTGVDWQLLYLPVMAAAGAAWLLVLRRNRARPWFTRAWVAGAGAWALAQALEVAQWDGDVRQPGYQPMMVAEELAELLGTGLLLLAALSVARGRYGRSSTLIASRRSIRS